ncbi:hypothetical protein BT69DRAFT_1226204 [Atractiella rhizophila]|nr:hypothetical protein BT69DRAFT_1226204 [Atractiella rhizophila]
MDRLADLQLEFMRMVLNPQTPASYHSIPNKEKMPQRLWENAFHRLLHRMRNSIPPPGQEPPKGSADVLEHFRDFMIYAYGFLTHLLDEVDLSVFRNVWLEQLGDVARYMMVAATVTAKKNAKRTPEKVDVSFGGKDGSAMIEVDGRMIRDGASIGEAALNDWDLEEQETWRTTARYWFGLGLKEMPGTGRLHHHLALLCKGDELKALYHYSRSLTASHPYVSAKESILPLFEKENQARRSFADVSKVDLFIKLHGMLFTKIALDDFPATLARLEEKLKEDRVILRKENEQGLPRPEGWKPISEVEWIMMGVINVAALMQYGAEDGVLKKAMNKEPELKKPTANSTTFAPPPKHGADVVKRLSISKDRTNEPPLVFELAQKLAFSILSHLLQTGTRSVGQATIVCPYITIMFTFLSHVSKHPHALAALERQIPWVRLIDFFNKRLPPSLEVKNDAPEKLVGAPLPEDWCVRGMEWVGKTLFGRGYWKPRSRKDGETQGLTPSTESEMDVLAFDGDKDWISGGVVEIGESSSFVELATIRWKRVILTVNWLARSVPGLVLDTKDKEKATLVVLKSLTEKMRGWKAEEERRRKDEEEMRRRREREREEAMLLEVGIQARRRELRAILRNQRSVSSSSARPRHRQQQPQTLQLVPGYTTLVFDTNVFLGSMALFTTLLTSQMWTIVVPLAVVMELEGLKKNAPPLGTMASDSLVLLENSMKPHRMTLKIQTSKGNFLSDLTFRVEQFDFTSETDDQGYTTTRARNIDDIILRAVEFNKTNWGDRSRVLGVKAEEQTGSKEAWAKVALVTFDRNLRLKAGMRDLEAVREREMAQLLALTEKMVANREREKEELKTPIVRPERVESNG